MTGGRKKLEYYKYLREILSIDKYREIEPDLDRVIQQIAVMAEGSEFEFTEQELLDLADELIANE